MPPDQFMIREHWGSEKFAWSEDKNQNFQKQFQRQQIGQTIYLIDPMPQKRYRMWPAI